MRWPTVASIIRKDLDILGPYALAGAVWMFAVSALFHTAGDFSELLGRVGMSGRGLDFSLFVVFGIGLPAALTLFVILLAQTNVASDTRHDWLIRPVTPVELVASKVATILCVIVAPMIAGDFIYMMAKPASFEEAFAYLPVSLTCCALVLVLSWLVSTPFRAVLALLGMFVLLVAGAALAGVIKVALGPALAQLGTRLDPTPFPNLDDSWIVELVTGIGVYAIWGITLWLLPARRRPVTARRVFVGFRRCEFSEAPPVLSDFQLDRKPVSMTHVTRREVFASPPALRWGRSPFRRRPDRPQTTGACHQTRRFAG